MGAREKKEEKKRMGKTPSVNNGKWKMGMYKVRRKLETKKLKKKSWKCK